MRGARCERSAIRTKCDLRVFIGDQTDEQSAIDHLRSIRWRAAAYCPYCKSKRVMHFSDKRTHKCGDCRKRFSIKVGTIFEDTKIELRKWFMAIWLIT